LTDIGFVGSSRIKEINFSSDLDLINVHKHQSTSGTKIPAWIWLCKSKNALFLSIEFTMHIVFARAFAAALLLQPNAEFAAA
jgi:hypothetical protein